MSPSLPRPTTGSGHKGATLVDDARRASFPAPLPARDGAGQEVPLSHAQLTADTPGRARLERLLDAWTDQGWLRPLDRAFAHFLGQEVPDASPLALLAAALASHQLGRGHACLDLEASLRDPAFALSLPPEGAAPRTADSPPHPAEVLAGLSLAAWRAALSDQAGRTALDLPGLVGQGAGDTPLVLAGPRLYLRRYWEYEGAVGARIQARLACAAAPRAETPPELLRRALDRLFPPTPARPGPDWQKLACALASRGAFSVITGGPGTGKTTTVVRLLALLQVLALAAPAPGKAPRPLRIRLAAPTGKAAARLNAAIAGAVADLPLAELAQAELAQTELAQGGLAQGGSMDAGLADAETLRASIPLGVTTLHRLLGSRPDTRRLRHHAGNPLALDLLVIDEASMIDLEMMAAVLAALPPQARLILLGDKDQLASVEAGAVLGQLCQRAAAGHYTPATRDWLEAVTGERLVSNGEEIGDGTDPGTAVGGNQAGLFDPAGLIDPAGTALDQAIVMLRHSHRFAADSGIGQLAAAVNAGHAAAVRELWSRGHRDLALVVIASEAATPSGNRDVAKEGTASGHRDAAKEATALGHQDAASGRVEAPSGRVDAAFRQLLIHGGIGPPPRAASAPPDETAGVGDSTLGTSAALTPDALSSDLLTPDALTSDLLTPDALMPTALAAAARVPDGLTANAAGTPPSPRGRAVERPRVGYRHFLEVLRQERPPAGAPAERYDAWATAVLDAQGQFQVLCALRHGPWGVTGLNATIAHLLREAGLIPASEGWYLGRPVLVTRNDYALGLMNGDIGVTLARPAAAGETERLRVAFPAGDGHQGIRWVLPSRLQAVETVFALTVHKSQGSEFTHAALVLPDKPSPILTRELLYTGITRARHYFTLVRPGDERVLEQAIERRVLRASGLLAGGSDSQE